MKRCDKSSANLEIRPRCMELSIRRIDSQMDQNRTRHQRFLPAEPPHADWNSYASQQHVRDLAVDTHRNCIWLATWGGVLQWDPGQDQITRYTSEHGLIGNATRAIAVDQDGVVWAAGQEIGLCSLIPENGTAWNPHPKLQSWTILCLTSYPYGGIYVALRNIDGRSALGHIAAPVSNLRILFGRGLAIKEIDALLVDEEKKLWIGNAWGLHGFDEHNPPQSFDAIRAHVRALSVAIDGGLWIGTNQGLYKFKPGSSQPDSEGLTCDEVISLSTEPDTNDLWVVTSHQVGRITSNGWEDVHPSLSHRINKLITTNITGKNITWAGGSGGLCKVGHGKLKSAFSLSCEDGLSNAIQCLAIDQTNLWVGTAQGLYSYNFDTHLWKNFNIDTPDLLRDVRAILTVQADGKLWIGTWSHGLCFIMNGYYLPDPSAPTLPVVSIAEGTDGTLWAATLDAIYWRKPDSREWNLVPGDIPGRPPDTMNMGVIQVICPQMVADGNNHLIQALWVGTFNGLFRYRPDGPIEWDSAREWEAPIELEQASIQALTLDLNNHLWIGTSNGLFCQHNWQLRESQLTDVRALTFTLEGKLWIGTSRGLEIWPAPDHDATLVEHPDKRMTVTDSGLASNLVTALAIRTSGETQDVWIGSLSGLSCYHY